MGYAFDLLFLSYIVYGGFRIFKNPARRNVAGLAAWGAASFCGGLVLWGALKYLLPAVENLLLRFMLALLLALISLLLCRYQLRPLLSPLTLRRDQPPLSFPRALRFALNSLFLAGFLGVNLFWINVVGLLAGCSSSHAHFVQQSLLLRTLAFSSFTDLAQADAITLQSWQQRIQPHIAVQQQAWTGIREGCRRAKAFFLEHTHADVVFKQLQMVGVVLRLSDEEKLWLIQTNPALQRLATHPALLAIVNDERVLELIADASQGSLPALYQLGEEPCIQALFQDASLMAHIRAVRLKDLIAQIQARR